MSKLRLYSVMPLNTDYIDEICEDIKEQYESGVANCALFSMTLVPEGTPPVNKAKEYGRQYLLFKNKLSEMGLQSGILVQASIGHGYPLGADSPFQKYVNLNDGNKVRICCPYDDAFCQYFKEVMKTLAATHPHTIMVDDDFRLLYRKGNGCACPLHMAEFNRRAKTNLTREELFDHLLNDQDGRFAQIFIEIQKESLLKAARAMRAGIDIVDPSIPGVFCGCGDNMEFAGEVAEILAGKGNPVVVRVNNGNYAQAGARYFSKICYHAAIQRERLKDKVQIILAETDTCPQNRYSTAAQSLHAHMVGSIMEGASGAKHWITRIVDYEPNSGLAYRRILGKNSGLYEQLTKIVPGLIWKGCRMPLTSREQFTFTKEGWGPEADGTDGFSHHVLERMGIPVYFSSEHGGAVFLAGKADEKFTDEEIKEFFKGPIFLAAEAARNLIRRGFGEYIGIDVKEWNGVQPRFERIMVNGKLCAAQQGCYQLIPMHSDVRADSMVCHTVDRINYIPISPGSTVFYNGVGGVTVVFSGTPITRFHITEAFSFLNESRKHQIISLLKECGQLPLYYVGDEEVFIKVADMSDGRTFCCLFNIGLDPIERIKLATERRFEHIEMMQGDGSYKRCGYHWVGEEIIIEEPAYTLNPVILILS